MSAAPRVAVVCSAHGYGHTGRMLALAPALVARGLEPVLFTAAPASFTAGRGVAVEPCVADLGMVQPDALSVDVEATRRALPPFLADAHIDALAARLAGFDLVIADTPPAALEAARRAGVPALAVGNFDWAWIYAQAPALAAAAARFAGWQAPHPALALAPGPGMHGFRTVEAVGLLARAAPPAAPLPGAVLVAMGGMGWAGLGAGLPEIAGTTYLIPDPLPLPARADCARPPPLPFPALLGAVDAVLTKPGYGTLAEAMAAGARLISAPRSGFAETASLEAAMRARGDILLAGTGPDALRAALAAARALPRPAPVAPEAAGRIAARAAAMVTR